MTPPAPTPDLSSPQAGLWLTLAQAFLPPQDRATAQAFLAVLSEDLRELCVGAGVGHAPEIAAFESSLTGVAGAQALLAHYSALFLAPPARACLNMSYYLEGTINGDSQDLVDALLARHDVRRRDEFHDLSDHLAALLELMAVLSAEAGSETDRRLLAHEILLPALAGLERDIARHEPRSPYRALAQLACRALTACAPCAFAEAAAAEHRTDSDHAAGAWRACRRCGEAYAREKDLTLLRHALAAHGLPADHLDICPACRNPATADLARQVQAGGLAPS